MQFFCNEFGDRYLYEVNRNTFNRLGADSQFRRHFGERLETPDTLHIIVGTDSGLLVRHLSRTTLPEGSKYLFVELASLLPLIQEELADLEREQKLVLATPENWQEQLMKLDFGDYANIDAVALHESIGAADAFFPEYRSLMSSTRQQLDAIMWSYRSQLGHPIFVIRQLENLLESHMPASRLQDAFPGKTAIVLGGGPSLDEILPWLQQRQDELVILAVSRICRRLQQVGIKPHIVVTIDPTQMSFDISREFLQLDSDVVLARANHAAFKLAAQWPGRSVYLGNRYPWHNKDEPENLQANGPTVTNTAIGLAIAMGVEQIILAGVDLCHDRMGHTHARGSNEREQGPRPPAVDIEVETNEGRIATTTPDFFNAMRAMELQAMAAKESGIRMINPAPGAARMQNIEFLPLESIRYHPLKRPPLEQLHNILTGDDSDSRLRNIEEMQKALVHANGRIRKIIKLTEEALDCNARLFGRTGEAPNFKYKKRMDKIERQLDREYKDVSVLVRMFSARQLLHMPPSDREWTDEEIEQAGITYYTAYNNNARQLLDLIDAARERLEIAAMEVSNQPDLDRLIAQWLKDDIPGRAIVWQRRHPETATALAPDQKIELRKLEKKFNEQLNDEDTLHRKQIAEAFHLRSVRARLQMLFKRQDIAELERLIEQLRQYETLESAELQQLAKGYLSELQGRKEAAFQDYGGLISLGSENPREDGLPGPCLEDALTRMAAISLELGHAEQAKLILQTLVDFSPVYAPQLAELLRITGDWQEAAAVYGDYIAKAPNDLSVMFRLGRLYQEYGADESARTAFEYILEKDPSNINARTLLNQLGTAQNT